ncbi:hypothetical protein Tco_0845119 [Tanacetum coccineum]
MNQGPHTRRYQFILTDVVDIGSTEFDPEANPKEDDDEDPEEDPSSLSSRHERSKTDESAAYTPPIPCISCGQLGFLNQAPSTFTSMVDAEVARLLAYLLHHHHLYSPWTPPLHLLSTDRREDRPEVTLPPRREVMSYVTNSVCSGSPQFRKLQSADLLLAWLNAVGQKVRSARQKVNAAGPRVMEVENSQKGVGIASILNSWTTETGPSTGLKMTVPSTAEEKICKKNDVKARSLLLMALPNEHQLTFDLASKAWCYKDWKEKFFCPANHVREEEPKKARENNDAPIIEDWVSNDEDEVEPIPKVEKKTVIPTATKKEFVKLEKPVWRSVRYVEMYRSQRPRGNQRNWNGHKSNQLGCNFVFNNKAYFICGSFDHIQYSCPKTSHPSAHKHMAPRAVLMKTGLKTVNTARPVNTVRSVNTGRPFSTARSFNTVRPSYTAHPKSTVHCARPRTYFQNQAQSTVQRPFYMRTVLTKRSLNQNVNTGRQNVNTVRTRGFNAVKPSACWVWKPIKPNGASVTTQTRSEE